MCIYIYIYVHSYVCIYIYIYACIHVDICVYIGTGENRVEAPCILLRRRRKRGNQGSRRIFRGPG